MINGMLGIILFVVTTSVKAISSMEDNMLGLEKNISIGNATQGTRGDRNIPIFNVISFPNRLGDYKLIALQSIIKPARDQRACALRALGLLLADGTPTVGGRKTF